MGQAHLPPDQVAPDADGDAATSRVAEPFVTEALRWLPDGRAPERLRPAPAARRSARARRRAGARLVADDNADMREYLTRLLRAAYDVTAVSDGAAALAAARRSPPDLVSRT